MPMGLVSDEDFENESHKLGIGPKPKIVDIPVKGRKEGDKNVPPSLQKIIGETSITDGPKVATELASSLGISRSSVSAYSNGSTSTSSYDNPSTELTSHLNNVKERISKRARHKLLRALAHITDEKLAAAKVSDLALSARAMSAIVKEMEPEHIVDDTSKGPTFVIFSPQIKSEESFDVIDLKTNE